jgi:hypothetical protein
MWQMDIAADSISKQLLLIWINYMVV